MAVKPESVIHVEVQPNTVGGDTYWVETTNWPGELHALCYRRVKHQDERPEQRCSKEAGWNTDHFGTGACKYHGGVLNMGNIKTGAHSPKLRLQLGSKIDDFINSNDHKELLNLQYELATMRVLIREVLDRFPDDPTSDSFERKFAADTRRITEMIQATGSLVDKISRIETRNTLTAAHILYIRARIAHILVKYIEDPRVRDQAIADLAMAIPGGKNDEGIVNHRLPNAS